MEMNNLQEEVEIKIEYFEKLETDPLTLVQNVIKNDTVEEHRVTLNCMNNNTNVFCYEGDGISTASSLSDHDSRTETTWYKELDNSGRFICKFCELCYSTIQTLRFHVKTKHPDRAENLKHIIIKNKRNSKIKCHICKKSFKSIDELKDHVKVYHAIENMKFSCHLCDASFTNRMNLMQHIFQKHEKILKKSMYTCNVCGYRTIKTSHFKQHLNVHSDRKDKKCQYCDYSTNYSPNLKIHERIHLNYKPYVCDFRDCHYSCSAKSGLRSHQLKHYRDDNMLYCDKCSYKTVYKQSLKKHCDSHARNSIQLKLL